MLDEFKNAFQRHNNAHVQLILINVVIFLVIGFFWVVGEISGMTSFSDLLYDQFTIPPKFSEFLSRPWTLITYMFAHSRNDIFHILFNMLVFYWFAKLFIEYLGSDKLIAVYVLGGLAGGLAYLLVFNLVPYFVNRSDFTGMVGASAAVYAVVVAIATLLPDYTFYLMFLGPIKIKYIAAFYVVISFLGTTQANAGGNIAHLGGALMGFIYTKQLKQGNDLGAWLTKLIDRFSNKNPRSKMRVAYKRSISDVEYIETKKYDEEQIDRILDKISKSGYNSLTKEEKEILFSASDKKS